MHSEGCLSVLAYLLPFDALLAYDDGTGPHFFVALRLLA